ncbi:hypothetical protein KM176_03600 [Pseudooceanicola sp. CBS1P-1]|uniref:Uncharacterized protein n=1 Tax=Pseudooceanicola albus TaxID=2692189 RepID=A0A6L7G9D3_9RHOB|nr:MULTISPECIES: hypothetical protein [Pseudooceanicola]MBT9382938.1 hypothetical protein [Pseudooceanicola endophyticus]MXN20138.1 hypothetical protein [Pseudooceanicola albus]
MVDAETFRREEARLETLLRRRMRRRDGDFESLLLLAGKRLPRGAQGAAEEILRARQMMGHPKLARQLDDKALKRSFRTLERGLKGFDPKERRARIAYEMASGLGINLAILFLLLMALAWWQGWL